MTNVVLTSEVFDASVSFSPGRRGALAAFLSRFKASPADPSLGLSPLEKASPDVWEARVDPATSGVFFKDQDTWYLLHVGQPDEALAWATQRKITRNAITGVPSVVAASPASKARGKARGKTQGKAGKGLLAHHSDPYLLSFGFPEELLPALKAAASSVELIDLAQELPGEQADLLLELAMGNTPQPPQPRTAQLDIRTRPDLQQRFYVVGDDAELRKALSEPHEKWIVFLHPGQRSLVELSPSGPTKVSGGAGTGKTVVALHRARFLARQGKSVLLTTFTRTMVRALERALDLLCTPEERPRIRVQTLAGEILSFAKKMTHGISYATDEQLRSALRSAASGSKYKADFLVAEWESVLAASRAFSLPAYLKAKRVGRGTALSREQKAEIWGLVEQSLASLRNQHLAPWDLLAEVASQGLESKKISSPYDAVIVDEVQDLTPSQLYFARAVCNDPRLLMLVGDAGQRIYRAGFALSSVGIAVKGRSHILKVNYRTTRQIRAAAGRVLGDFVPGPEGEPEPRTGIRDLLSGIEPSLVHAASAADERKKAVALLKKWIDQGVDHTSIAVFAPTNEMADNLGKALEKLEIPVELLKKDEALGLGIRIGTMHRAKGLEFLHVLVIGASAEDMGKVGAPDGADPADARAAEEMRRNLLYVAMTRARQELHVSWAGSPSPFLKPLLETSAA